MARVESGALYCGAGRGRLAIDIEYTGAEAAGRTLEAANDGLRACFVVGLAGAAAGGGGAGADSSGW